jgi:hypothetical protein
VLLESGWILICCKDRQTKRFLCDRAFFQQRKKPISMSWWLTHRLLNLKNCLSEISVSDHLRGRNTLINPPPPASCIDLIRLISSESEGVTVRVRFLNTWGRESISVFVPDYSSLYSCWDIKEAKKTPSTSRIILTATVCHLSIRICAQREFEVG